MVAAHRSTQMIRHAKVRLALHRYAGRELATEGRPLLLLHGLGERSADRLPEEFASWPGPVHALDFTGHGDSEVPAGGGYTAEVLMADADAALASIGDLTVCGRGLGAYVALLLAGGRARQVHGAILCDGPGLAGGGPQPSSPTVLHPDPHASGSPDPLALAELTQDVRPPDYAMSFVRQAAQLGPFDPAITVCARNRPEWLRAVADAAESEIASLDDALALHASGRGAQSKGIA